MSRAATGARPFTWGNRPPRGPSPVLNLAHGGRRRSDTNFVRKLIALIAGPILSLLRKHELRLRHRSPDVAFREPVPRHEFSRAQFQRSDSRQTVLSSIVRYEIGPGW